MAGYSNSCRSRLDRNGWPQIDGGGEIVAWGPPEDIKAQRSYTAKFLEPVLKKANAPRKKSRGASEAAE
jgi:excinuclease ABC subunit A